MTKTQETIASILDAVSLPRLKYEICADQRVLVVDDEPITRAITKALLQKFGFADVQDASDGASALDILRGSEFRLVISDLFMAPMSGLDLFRAMRADRRLRGVPFIMLTANLNHDTVLASKRAGIEHYLIKPFRLGALHEKLVELLAPHEAAS